MNEEEEEEVRPQMELNDRDPSQPPTPGDPEAKKVRLSSVLGNPQVELDIIERLLADGADPNRLEEEDGLSPLVAACLHGRKDLVETLLDHGAVIEADEEKAEHTPLSAAVSSGHIGVVELLLREGAVIVEGRKHTDSWFGLSKLAITRSNQEMLQFLLSQGITHLSEGDQALLLLIARNKRKHKIACSSTIPVPKSNRASGAGKDPPAAVSRSCRLQLVNDMRSRSACQSTARKFITPVPRTMRTLTTLVSALCAALTVGAFPQTAEFSIQPISSSRQQSPPFPFASVSYDLAAIDSSTVTSYDAPEIPDASSLVRIGVYDPKTKSWASGTTVASTENFAKGYSPTITVSVNSRGDVLSAALKGVQIDAGQTRDFGPKVVILPEGKGPQPALNKPVIVSSEGKKVEEEVEKTFLQKYWWMIGIAVFIALSGGGGEQGK
ncbi:Ankyrin repeat-containing domain protein [Metarhizium rileyi]|uniref:Ankyrin repeat-containing domain protein n=1 Tax=Metarhizium rileyi (strain RCEF 4871) TaxID=1649241 RepID=A0A167CNJ0_METRR|nr:Ankyrin repeat-containing domain protein [Metarhizium rileyi RCEF 4871]